MSLELVLKKSEVENLKIEIVPSTLVIDSDMRKRIDESLEIFF